MTKAQKEAAAKARGRKAARTRQKNKKEKELESKRRAAARKRATTQKKGGFLGLGDILTPTDAQATIDTGVNAAFGAGLAYLTDEIISRRMDATRSALGQIIVGGLAATVGNRPQVGSACMGAGFKQLFIEVRKGRRFRRTYLRDGQFVDNLEALPPVLDVTGTPMNDNSYLAQNNSYLAQNGLFPGMNNYNPPYTFSGNAF